MRFLSRTHRSLSAHRSLAIGMLLTGFFWRGGAAQALDRDKVRAAVPLPQMQTDFNFSFNAQPDGPTDIRPARVQIAELEAAPPTTSEGWVRLGRLYLQTKDFPHAKSSFERAVVLLLPEMEAHPDDAIWLVQLGKAQSGAIQLEAAEATLRRATEISPYWARAWTELGDVQLQRATKLILPSEGEFQVVLSGNIPTYSGLSKELLDGRPAPAVVAQSKALLAGAFASYARAVKVAPQDPDIYIKRIGARPSQAFVAILLANLEASQEMPLKTAVSIGSRAYSTLISPQSAADFQTVARLKPRDASANGLAALATLMSSALSNGREIPLQGGLDSLPAPVSGPVREDIKRLELLSQRGAKDEAAALEALGVIAFILDDTTAKDKLSRALVLDPMRVQARELLVGLLSTNNDFEGLATFAQAQLKREDTARYHLILAKADDKLGRAPEVETQVNAALKLDANDITANLARVALDLRAGDVRRATESLARTAPLLAPAAKPAAQQTSEYALFQATLLALNDQPEAAKTALQSLLTADPNDKSARELLDALGA